MLIVGNQSMHGNVTTELKSHALKTGLIMHVDVIIVIGYFSEGKVSETACNQNPRYIYSVTSPGKYVTSLYVST